MVFFSFTDDPNARGQARKSFTDMESMEFSGKALVALLSDPKVIRKTGKILLTADLAREYGFVDDNGQVNSYGHYLVLKPYVFFFLFADKR